MKTYLECIPCFGKQVVEVAGMLDDQEQQHKAVKEMLAAFAEYDLQNPPPVFAQRLARIARPYLDGRDPFQDVKERFNTLAMHILPDLMEEVKASPDPFGLASRLDINPFREKFLEAEKILWLADNAGEIVLDQLLMAFTDPEKITIAVRAHPILNDATMDDAESIGLVSRYKVIENGSDAPGTILDDCSPEFMECFADADLIVSKGQGNYETLSSLPDKRIFFLLKAKCPVIARDIGCDVGRLVIARK